MNAGKAVYGILSANSGVTDIVSTRIFPEIAEQEAVTPFIVYQLQNVSPEDTHDGPSKLDEVQFEFLCYADSYNAAADLGTAVRAALDRVSGTYNGVNVESVQFNDVDVEIEYDPRRYSQVLKFTFRIKRDDVEIALGTPVTGAQLGDLSDVNVSGATDNQVLSYDAATNTWIPANDGGAIALDDLSDVDAGQPEDGQLLSYGQGGWTTIAQDELEVPIGSVTGLQAALDATPDALDDLTDVKIVGTPTDGDALVYSSGFWSRGTAGASTLGALTDVNLTTPSTGAYLQYDGAEWIDSVITLPSVPSTYYHNRYATEAETLRAGATATVEIYYTAQADGDGYAESAESDTATAGYDIRRKLYYSEAAQADPDTGTWVQFADIADDTTFASAKATLLAYLKERTGGTVPISLKMTWEEVAEATLLLDTYTGAAAAYSLRQLRTAYSGSAIRVRRASDNTEQDIGFDGSGELDTTSLASFCSGTDGFVATWYDQANSNDATQSTTANQPKIYDSSTGVVTENGKPVVRFNSDFLSTSCSFSFAGANFLVGSNQSGTFEFATSLEADADNQVQMFLDSRSSTKRLVRYEQSGTTSFIDLDNQILQGTQSLLAYNNDNGTLRGYVDGTAVTNTASFSSLSVTQLHLARLDSTTSGQVVDLQECIWWSSDQSANRTGIESNINTFYSIY